MYIFRKPSKSLLNSVEKFEGESIERKVERVQTANETIKDGAPEIFTERKDGIVAAYNIRTDRWEVAAEAMAKVEQQWQKEREARAAMRDNAPTGTEGKGTDDAGESGA